jgi:hypothetical protein
MPFFRIRLCSEIMISHHKSESTQCSTFIYFDYSGADDSKEGDEQQQQSEWWSDWVSLRRIIKMMKKLSSCQSREGGKNEDEREVGVDSNLSSATEHLSKWNETIWVSDAADLEFILLLAVLSCGRYARRKQRRSHPQNYVAYWNFYGSI